MALNLSNMGDTGFFSTTIWMNVTSIFALLYAFYLCAQSDERLINGQQNPLLAFILCTISIIYIGKRPIWCYADTHGYTLIFNFVKSGFWPSLPGEDTEPLWTYIEYLCIEFTDASGWLLLVAFCYIFTRWISIKKILPNHTLIAFIFLITSFTFFGYATNTIRHGVATGFCMLALSFIVSGKTYNKIIGIGILIASIYIHKSTMLVLLSLSIALIYKNTNRYLTIWLLSILLSLIVPEFFKQFLSGYIEDPRFTAYANITNETSTTYKVGYRWDFIIYSSLPILLGWYVIVGKKLYDKKYLLLFHTYLISNSIWILINNIAFSDRFAHLSWFLYPIVILYPLCVFKIFNRQSLILGLILITQVFFTYLMK